jgi:hypothetical protein
VLAIASGEKPEAGWLIVLYHMHRIFSAATLLQLKSGAKVEVLEQSKREHCTPFLFGKKCYTCEKKVVLLRVFFNTTKV